MAIYVHGSKFEMVRRVAETLARQLRAVYAGEFDELCISRKGWRDRGGEDGGDQEACGCCDEGV